MTCPKSHSWDVAELGVKGNLCVLKLSSFYVTAAFFPREKYKTQGRVNIHLLITFRWVIPWNPPWWASLQASSKDLWPSGQRQINGLAIPYVLITDQLQNSSSGLGSHRWDMEHLLGPFHLWELDLGYHFWWNHSVQWFNSEKHRNDVSVNICTGRRRSVWTGWAAFLRAFRLPSQWL